MAIFGRGFYGITSKSIAEQRSMTVLEQVWQLCEGGAVAVQLRDKETGDAELLIEAMEAKRICDRFSVPLIINDRLELAKVVGSVVHLGQDDIKSVNLDELLDEGISFGISTHSAEQALGAERSGAAYVGIGPVFGTPTKPTYKEIGFSEAEKVTRLLKIPAVVIGGLTLDHMDEVRLRGISNVAMVRAPLEAEKISDYVEQVNSFL